MEAVFSRSAEIAGISNRMVNDWEGIVLDFRSSDESTIHPANDLLVQALQHYFGDTYLAQSVVQHTTELCSHMIRLWRSKLEQDAELIHPGEKGRKYIFLLNNTYVVRQTVSRQGAYFPKVELRSRLSSMIEGYKKGYLDECWAPLNRLKSEEFTAEFLATCNRQRTWKVTAELRYQLRQEILDLVVSHSPYEVSNGSCMMEGLFEG
ncbi:hypothetical protein VPH35_025783 [Triticum aestivum]|uniref:Exocyst subunit Exo70 family protein n=2 Tax=Triticum TaxID=4564 RepID=A0A9R1RGC0_TRITD|nr:uncharacterized protein LOC123040083 [Triticum aestivum]VAH40489.1 unnamed protein product [Triticum turgidum subsp. durum]